MTRLKLLLPALAILFMMVGAFAGQASAHTYSAHGLAQHAVPMTTCSGSGCEGQGPPPVGPSNCTTHNPPLSTKTIWNSQGVVIGTLNLFTSTTNPGGCPTDWVGIHNTTSGLDSQNFQIIHLETIEGVNCGSNDGSVEGLYSGSNITVPPGGWSSSYMAYNPDGGCTLMHGYSQVSDQFGATITTNTATWQS